MGWFFYSIHLSISYLFRFWLKTHFLLLFYSSFNYYLFLDWTSRRSRGQAWWGLQECSKRWRHEAEVRRCWLTNPWKISKLELSKTFYALVTLDSGIFFIIGRFIVFLISKEIFHIKSCVIVSFALILLFDSFPMLDIICYLSTYVERMKYELKWV